MGWVLRRSTDRTNPTLAGGVYGFYITAGMGVYWRHDGSRVRFILFISDGGRYGMDALAELSYKGVTIPANDYKFHPGTYTKQIVPFQITSVDHSTDTVTLTNHPFNNNDPIRLRNRGGKLPAGVSEEIKVWIINKTADTFQFSSTDPAISSTLVNLTDNGTGTHFIWKANAGWDDPDQGLPQFCPEVQTTFSGICYAEGKLPVAYNTNEEPDWQEFRAIGSGRKLMDYDASGNETGLISGGNALLRNPALCGLDCLIHDYQKPLSRIDFPSLIALRDDAPVQVWQRTDREQSGTGWIGKYYNFTDSVPPNIALAALVLTRKDTTLNFDWASGSPAAGVNPEFIAVWEGILKFKYGETYTFKVTRDNGARIYFNGSLVYDAWTNTTATDATFAFAATADQLVSVKIEYFDGGSLAKFILKWSSPSLPEEVVPMESVYEPDQQIRRYEFSGACAAPTEAAEYFERIMKRCPGWDWTDKDGKIRFLPPTRPVVFEFNFDALDPDLKTTILDGTFQKKMVHRRERRNFALWSFRYQLLSGYPEQFVEQNRPRLRELGNGMPNNDPPEDLMVMMRGHAERISAHEFNLTTDVAYMISLEGRKAAAVATKSCFVRVKNFIAGDCRIENGLFMVQTFSRQGTKVIFEDLIPITEPFYEDEEV